MTYRNKMIVGIALAIGMGLYMQPKSLQFFPQLVRDIMGGSPIVVCFLIAFTLNILFPAGAEDREPEEDLVPIPEAFAIDDEAMETREETV
ncbi:hypothetical protein DSECCO2_320840 [anaerobic digester metagenome]